MTVTVAAKNYTIISGCENSTDNGTWTILTTQDGDSKKQGTYSLCGIVKTAGANTVTFTPTVAKDLSGTKHVRFWFLSTHGGLLNTYENDGLNFWASDGTNTGYWKILGKTKNGVTDYPGGWINCVIDVSKACDSGTKPTAMNAITSMGLRINLTGAGKNAVNTWVDHLCMCDGLTAYGDDAGGYFDIDDIYSADENSLGVGIVRKLNGQYFLAGSLDIGYATSATKFKTTSAVVVFENRRVNDALYALTVVDSGNASYTTECILGSKAGTAGIEGCMLRVQDAAQTCKYVIDGATDTDVDNFKLYGTTFYDSGALKFPNQPSGMTSVHRGRASNVATLGVNAHGLIVGNTVLVEGLGGTGYNGTWTVASVVDANHFTYACTGGDETETADTGGTITSKNVEVLNCNFESCDEVQATTGTITNCNFVSANDEAVILPSGNAHRMTYCSFISCPNAVRIPSTGTYDFTYLTFINNTVDVDNTSGGAVIVNCDHSNPVTETGDTTINNTVTLRLTVKALVGGAAIQYARVRLMKVSDNSVVLEGDTNASGIVQRTDWNYTSDIPIYGWARKATGSPLYKEGYVSGAIEQSGYNATVLLALDE